MLTVCICYYCIIGAEIEDETDQTLNENSKDDYIGFTKTYYYYILSACICVYMLFSVIKYRDMDFARLKSLNNKLVTLS